LPSITARSIPACPETRAASTCASAVTSAAASARSELISPATSSDALIAFVSRWVSASVHALIMSAFAWWSRAIASVRAAGSMALSRARMISSATGTRMFR
jgi:hypothetical protein